MEKEDMILNLLCEDEELLTKFNKLCVDVIMKVNLDDKTNHLEYMINEIHPLLKMLLNELCKEHDIIKEYDTIKELEMNLYMNGFEVHDRIIFNYARRMTEITKYAESLQGDLHKKAMDKISNIEVDVKKYMLLGRQ